MSNKRAERKREIDYNVSVSNERVQSAPKTAPLAFSVGITARANTLSPEDTAKLLKLRAEYFGK